MEKALAVMPERQMGIVNIEEYAMSLEGLVKQVQLIQRVMEKVMKQDEHYGVIPGTQKPTLLKPGAEKLCLTFRLDPNYEIMREIREKDFIAYTIKCDLRHIATGQDIASGIGSCNSRETKYRYRSENTGQPVPKEYWDDRDSSVLGGSQFRPRKKDGKWVIFEQIENDNPWDLDNTLVKMACKRALVAATLNATAASDIFTQDIEDMPKDIISGEDEEQSTKPPGKKSDKDSGGEPSEKQKGLIHSKMIKAGLNREGAQKFYVWVNPTTVREASEFIDQFDAKLEAYEKEQSQDDNKGKSGEGNRKQMGFNRKMHGLKDAIGEERYYKVLKKYKCKHATEVPASRMDEVEEAMKDALKAVADESRNSEGDSEGGDGKTEARRYFETEMQKFEETLGKPAFNRVLGAQFKVKDPGDVPEPEMKAVLKAMMEELDKQNAD